MIVACLKLEICLQFVFFASQGTQDERLGQKRGEAAPEPNDQMNARPLQRSNSEFAFSSLFARIIH